MTETVYILTNPRIPDLIKVGATRDLKESIRSLSAQAGTPFPYECYFACEVEDGKGEEIKDRLLEGFRDRRIDPTRDFLEVNPEQVKVILEGYRSDTRESFRSSPVAEVQADIETHKRTRTSNYHSSKASTSYGSELVFTWKGETITRSVKANLVGTTSLATINVYDWGLERGTMIYYNRSHNITAIIDGPKTCQMIIEREPLIVNGEYSSMSLNRAVHVAEIILDGKYKNKALWKQVFFVKDKNGGFISIEDHAKALGLTS